MDGLWRQGRVRSELHGAASPSSGSRLSAHLATDARPGRGGSHGEHRTDRVRPSFRQLTFADEQPPGSPIAYDVLYHELVTAGQHRSVRSIATCFDERTYAVKCGSCPYPSCALVIIATSYVYARNSDPTSSSFRSVRRFRRPCGLGCGPQGMQRRVPVGVRRAERASLRQDHPVLRQDGSARAGDRVEPDPTALDQRLGPLSRFPRERRDLG